MAEKISVFGYSDRNTGIYQSEPACDARYFINSCDIIGYKRRRKELLSVHQIQGLFDGKEIFDAIFNATDPCSIQVSDHQNRLLTK